jgi:predicted metal-dependent peptidase
MSTILAQARLRACQHWPFASHAILSMVPVPRPGLGTLSVDKNWRLYFDEGALHRMGTEQAAGLILHEIDHLLKRHHKRGEQLVGDDNAKWDTWNYAADAAINSGLRSEGIQLPDGVVYPERLDLPEGLSAEEYFRELIKPKDEPDSEETPDEDPEQYDSDREDDQPNEQETDHEPNESGETTEDSQEPDAEDSDPGSGTDTEGPADREHEDAPDGSGADAGDGNRDDHTTPEGGDGQQDGDTPSEAGEGATGTGSGVCGEEDQADGEGEAGGSDDWETQPVGTSGSCSDGRPRPWELGEPDDDNPGLDEADQEALIHVAAKNVLDKGCGKGAGGRRVWAEEVLDPPVNPAAKLLNLVRRYCDVTVGMGERSYRRPSRRNGNPRMVLPSNVAPLPRITVIVDTSGSMDQQDLGLALGMIRKVLNSFHIRDGINVVTGDAKGQSKQICMADPKRIELTGGGGTNMAAVIAEALEARPKPQMIILCTDGWTPWPTEDPGIPVVACVTRRVSTLPEMYQPPDWIVTLELNRSPI